ncbi:MAG: alpha/beta fold hydrolase, partial [Bacteroidota bacterium]
EFAAGLSKDDRTLYFTSERPGVVPALADSTARPPGDIYAVSLNRVAPGFLADERGQEITLPTPDGVTVYGDLYTVDKSNPTILLLHQGGANVRGEYRSIIPKLLEREYNVLALDLRQGGERFGYFNRTQARSGQSFHYCDAYPDVVAGLQYLQAEGYAKPVVWGSSFSATLAVQVAAQRPDEVQAVLAFSPAQGPPMKECQPGPYFEQISAPLLVFRPRSELAYEGLTEQLALIEELGHQTYIAENGVHGSSMLVPERVTGEVAPHWDRVWQFLEEAL